METMVLQIDNKRKLKLFADLAASLNIPYRLASSVDEIRKLINHLPDSDLTTDDIQEEIKQMNQ